MLAPYLVLALAIAAVWLPRLPPFAGVRLPPWVVLFCIALFLGVYGGIVKTSGLLSISFLVALLIGAASASKAGLTRLTRIFVAASIVTLFAFGLQLMPGFVGTTLVSNVRLSPDASPMRLVVRFDVGLSALFLVALYCERITSLKELRAVAVPTSAVALVTVAAVVGGALAAGYIRFDPKWPPFALEHLAKTLLVTAVVEEAFFRGVLQERLSRLALFKSDSLLKSFPVVFSALLFGLAHLPGGWVLAALATLAGFGYALAYGLTGRIEAPIAVHFLVNATHFLTFTYPRLAVTP